MRVPLSWLRELVDVDLTPEQLADRLTVLGMEVQGIERIGADWAHVVVGEILEVAPHPGSTRLSLTRIRTGDGPERAIVCGATNIAPGQRIPVALPGAVLPGDRRIEVTRIAGVESAGMLCSGAELGLTVDADGILILPGSTPIGVGLPELLGDTVLDVDVKPNRGDALCILGLAREVSAATGVPLRRPAIAVAEAGEQTSARLSVTIEDTRCSRFVGRRVDGVRVGPSPLEIQRRLMAAGMRPVSNVVDASNYVMLELGKPIHTFDAGAVGDGRIIVRAARTGERLETLDHVERTLDPDVLVIADPTGPLAIAGVMGGASSEVGPETTSVVIESAIFDPVSIRRTAFRYALRSEASLRFEKGQEHALARTGADRTAQLILAWAGGTATAGVVDTDPTEPPRATVAWRPRRVNRLLGTDLAADEQQALLGRVEIVSAPAPAGTPVTIIATEPPVVPDASEPVWLAEVPGHRRDLAIEADLAEEIARVRGYDALVGTLPSTAMPAYRRDPWAAPDMIRGLLAARGFAEVVTHALVGPEDHARLGLAADDPRTIRAENPVTVDHSELRRDLLPSLVAVLADNERQRRADVAIFEIGQVHTLDGRTPGAIARLGILAAGAMEPATWDGPGRAAGVGSLKSLLAWLVLRIGEATLRFTTATARDAIDHPGRTARVHARRADGTEVDLGTVGELDPRYLDACGIRAAAVAWADLDLAALLSVVPGRRRIGLPPRLPSVERDIAVVVPVDLPAGRVEETIRAAAGPQLAGLRLFDRYRGAPLAPDEVSLAWRLRFDPADEPLDDAALEPIVARIVAALGDALGARLRA